MDVYVYQDELTREFFRSIVREDKAALKRLVAHVRAKEGIIGQATLTKTFIIGVADKKIAINKVDLHDQTDFFAFTPERESLRLDGQYSWNMDWAWFKHE